MISKGIKLTLIFRINIFNSVIPQPPETDIQAVKVNLILDITEYHRDLISQLAILKQSRFTKAQPLSIYIVYVSQIYCRPANCFKVLLRDDTSDM